MKIRPLYDRIVVKRIEQQEQLQGGLYIPDSAKEKPQEGEVMAVGKGKRLKEAISCCYLLCFNLEMAPRVDVEPEKIDSKRHR